MITGLVHILRRTSFVSAFLGGFAVWGTRPIRAEADILPRTAIKETFDLRYFAGRDRQTLDVFAPKGAKDRPVVLFVHGGSWVIGDKNMFGVHRAVGRFLARHGYVAVLINYRLSPAVKHPEHARDVARAFTWVRANIAKYGGNSDQIVLCGHSAGGHLVSLLATDETYLKGADRAALRGVVSVSGVYRIPDSDDCARVVGSMLGGISLGDKRIDDFIQSIPSFVRVSPKLNPFRLAFGDDPAVRKDASPLSHVHKGLPPFLVLYASNELPLLAEQAVDFGKALKDAGDDVRISRIDGANHVTMLFGLAENKNVISEKMLKFLAQHTKK
jgi:acetyl esterase/lipase